jgi:hypothetical protein
VNRFQNMSSMSNANIFIIITYLLIQCNAQSMLLQTHTISYDINSCGICSFGRRGLACTYLGSDSDQRLIATTCSCSLTSSSTYDWRCAESYLVVGACENNADRTKYYEKRDDQLWYKECKTTNVGTIEVTRRTKG